MLKFKVKEEPILMDCEEAGVREVWQVMQVSPEVRLIAEFFDKDFAYKYVALMNLE